MLRAVFVMALAASVASIALAQMPPLFAIHGTLVTGGGDPVTDVTVFVHKGDRISLEIGADGRGANPTGKTDSSGRFVISVPRGFLPATQQITLSAGLGPQRELAHLRESKTNTPLSFKIAPDLRVLDLNRLVGKIVVTGGG